jgi:hypothetical protein
MARLYARDDRRRVLAGTLAGIVTAVLALAFWILWGGDPFAPADLLVDTDTVTAPPLGDELPADPLTPGPLVGVREQGIMQRLAAASPPRPRPIAAFDVRARDIVWRDPAGVVWARASAMTGRIDARAAGRGDIVAAGVTVSSPRLDVRQDARGNWNWETVFADLLDDDRPVGPARLFTLRDVRIVDGHAEVRTPEQRFDVTTVTARLASVTFSDLQRRDPSIVVASFDGTLVHHTFERRVQFAAGDGLLRFPTGRILFDIGTATVDGIQLAGVAGEWSGAIPGLGVRATGRIVAATMAQLQRWTDAALPDAGRVSADFEYEPLTATRTRIALSDLDMTADGSRVLGSLVIWQEPDLIVLRQADLRLDPLTLALIEAFTGPLPYDGTLVGTVTGAEGDISFSLLATLRAPQLPQFTTQLTGRALMTPTGVALQRLEADLRAVPLLALRPLAPGLPLQGTVTGTVVLTGMPDRTPLELDIRLQLAAGLVTLAGELDMTGAVPTYDLSGRLVGVNVQTLLEPDVPPVALTARFTASGSGFDLATAVARITIDGQFSGWETGPADRVVASFVLRAGEVAVDTLSLQLATLRLDAGGVWRIVDPVGGAVTYRAVIADLRPFGPYIPVLGDELAAGSLTAEGSFSGSLERMRVEGGVAARAVQLGGWRADELLARYSGVIGDPVPEIVLDASAAGLVTPTAGIFETATAVVRLTPPLFALDVEGERADGTGVQIVAEGQIPWTGPRELLVQRARFDIEDQRWVLVEPFVVRWGEVAGGIVVAGMALEDVAGAGRIRIDGRLLPLDAIDARVETVALPVAGLQRLLGEPARLTGLLSSVVRVSGPGDAPTIEIEFRLDEGGIEGLALTRFDGTVRYAAGLLEARATTVLAEAGTLEIEAALPVRIALVDAPTFEWIEGAAVSGRAVADGLDLAPLAVLSPFITDARGIVQGAFDLTGTVENPVFAGRFQLHDGAATFPDIRQRYTEAFADVEMVGRQVVLRDFRARSDGWLTGSGAVTFTDLRTPEFDFTMNFDGFRAVGTRERGRGGAVTGTASLSGTPTLPVLTGRLRFDDGTVEFPEMAGPDDVDIFFAEFGPAGMPGLLPAPAPPQWWDPLRIENLVVVAGDNLWVSAFNARVQLAGELTVDRVGEVVRIFGTLEGTRGQYILAAGPIVRRFDIVAATVRFLGTGELNPQIDITARRRVIDPGGRHVEIDVRVGGTARSPTLALASPDAEQMPQSELLSFLLFGQPSFALGGGVIPGEALLEHTFVGGLAELASLELEQAIVQDLGLPVDIFQIRWGAGRFGGFGTPTIFLGREVTTDVWLTVETGLAALFAETEGGTETWAVRLEWAMDRRTVLRAGYEPVRPGRLLRGLRFALPATRPQQQFSLELRRRWYY